MSPKKNLLTLIWRTLFFYQRSSKLYDVMQEEIENLEFVESVNFEFIYSFTNNGTKYLLFFDDSCDTICSSKAFVDLANAAKQRALSTIYNKNNSFYQSRLGRGVELPNTHIILFKSHRDVVQVSTPSAQLELRSELVDWFWDAIFVPYDHFLIEMSPRKYDRLRYCTNTGSIPSGFYNPARLKQSNFSDDEHTKFLYSASAPLIFPQMQKPFASVLSKRS